MFVSESDSDENDDTGIPGQLGTAAGQITLNDSAPNDNDASNNYIELAVTNTGRPSRQVGSHYAFVETNRALRFDRRQAVGRRLNVPAGASVRFEPGESKQVTLCLCGGNQRVGGGTIA